MHLGPQSRGLASGLGQGLGFGFGFTHLDAVLNLLEGAEDEHLDARRSGRVSLCLPCARREVGSARCRV